jgi:hypothetical protein
MRNNKKRKTVKGDALQLRMKILYFSRCNGLAVAVETIIDVRRKVGLSFPVSREGRSLSSSEIMPGSAAAFVATKDIMLVE